MKKTIKIVELNVNQRGRLSRYLNEKLLDYVDFRTDVLILLEYNSLSVNAKAFEAKLADKGFVVYKSNNGTIRSGNDILIAIRVESDINVKCVKNYVFYSDNKSTSLDDIPENLFLEVEINKCKYLLVAVRIKELSGQLIIRRKEMERLLSWLLEYSDIPFIICGDFNNLRTDTIEKEWNLEVLDKLVQMNDLLRCTPKKHNSWGVSKKANSDEFDGYIAEDHLIISKGKNIGIKPKEKDSTEEECLEYSWDYLKNNIKECEVDPVNKYGEQKINVPIGFPDHAMLLAEIELDD